MASNKTLCIAEWQAFGADNIKEILADKSEEKAQKIFAEFENFAKESGDFDDRTGNHIFLMPCRKNGKNMLKARNFVGLVQTKSGFCLEILPKTFRAKDENEGFKNSQEKITKAKEVLLNMLATLRDSPFKQSHISNLAIKNLPLLEVFALMFLSELERLIKRGLKSDYVGREQNRRFLKGRLLFAQNLRQNLAHKERFFTAADEYTADNAPNRLIKSTLLLLAAQGFSAKTSGRILQARFVFDEISPSKNIDKDFAQSVNFRRFKDYELLLLWCAVFLRRKNFLPYQGSQSAFALLFDMNKLFESFVAWCLRKSLGGKCVVKAQEKAKFLAQKDGQNVFQIKPDIAIYKKSDKNSPLIIADTKWKILSDDESANYEISQGDLYQMFAYLAKYQCYKGYLIYPKIQSKTAPKNLKLTYKAKLYFYENEQAHKDIELNIHFFKLEKYMQKIHGI